MNRSFIFDNNYNFKYYINDFDKINTLDYIDAIDNTVLNLYKKSLILGIEKIGLCLSGIDSELIASSINRYKIPVEYFFLNILGINDNQIPIVSLISKKYDTKLNIITRTIDDILYNDSLEIFKICPVAFPGYNINPIIIKYIPKDFFIIIGEGDLEKSGVEKYFTIFNNCVKDYDSNFFYIPMHLSEIIYNKCLDFYEKKGESNFYSYDFNTWYHILKNKNLRTNGKFFYDPKSQLIWNMCKKDFTFKEKTDTFEYGKNISTVLQLMNNYKQYPNTGWHKFIGDVIKVSKDLIF